MEAACFQSSGTPDSSRLTRLITTPNATSVCVGRPPSMAFNCLETPTSVEHYTTKTYISLDPQTCK